MASAMDTNLSGRSVGTTWVIPSVSKKYSPKPPGASLLWQMMRTPSLVSRAGMELTRVPTDQALCVARPSTLLRLVLFLALMLVVRGGPALLLYRRVLPRVQRLPLAVFSATGLPLIVVITAIGTAEGRIRPENAAALVGAGMVSVLCFPAMGLRMLRNAAKTDTDG
jgi:hypothetical protein